MVVAICVPPTFDPLGALFAPDVAHATIVGRIADRPDAFIAVAPDTASDVAARVRRAGHDDAVVVGSAFDTIAAAMLADALRRAGVATVRVALGDASAIDGDATRVRFGANVDFARDDDGTLLRTTAGATATIPAAIETIVFDAEPSGDRTLAALSLADARTAIEAGTPSDRIRLLPPREPERSTRPKRPTSADWCARYGLDDARTRADLVAFVDRHAPGHALALRARIADAEAGIDPVEEMFAGHALVDRNRDLLVNLVGAAR